MPLHDYWCQTCGQISVDIYRSVLVGAQADPPTHCDRPMAWIPDIGAMDAFEPGQEFEVRNGQNQLVKVESFAQMHKLEQESEQQFRNGEGQPIRFRMLHQHRTNREDNTFGPSPEEKPSAEMIRKYKPTETTAEGPGYGPGVSDANTSPLKD